jgi:hypothetical protein
MARLGILHIHHIIKGLPHGDRRTMVCSIIIICLLLSLLLGQRPFKSTSSSSPYPTKWGRHNMFSSYILFYHSSSPCSLFLFILHTVHSSFLRSNSSRPFKSTEKQKNSDPNLPRRPRADRLLFINECKCVQT